MRETAIVIAATLEPRVPYTRDQDPALVYIARLGKGSRRTMKRALCTIAEIVTGSANATILDWHQLRYQHTQAVRSELIARYKPATANKHLSALRGVLKEAWRLGHMSGDDYQRAVDLEVVRGHSLPAGRELQNAEIVALFRICAQDRTPAGARDAALIAILYSSGLRRSEVVALALCDYERESGALTVRCGKGNKDRLAYAASGARAAINAWLLHRGDGEGSLLCPVNKGGKIAMRRMGDQSVLGIVRKRAKQAGVDRFSPHDCRRTFVSHLLDAGADIASVQKLAGHASVATTARYDRRGERAKREAAELLHVPFTTL